MHREEGALDKFYNANVNLATGLQAVDFVFTRGVEEFRKVLFFLFSFGRGGGGGEGGWFCGLSGFNNSRQFGARDARARGKGSASAVQYTRKAIMSPLLGRQPLAPRSPLLSPCRL